MCSGLCVKSFVAHKLQSTTQLSHCEMDVVSQPHKGHAMASPNVKQLVGCPEHAKRVGSMTYSRADSARAGGFPCSAQKGCNHRKTLESIQRSARWTFF